MLHVRQRVPLRRRLRIEVVEVVVEHEIRVGENLDRVGMLAAREQRRVGDVDRQIHREDFARANRRGGRNHALRRQQVDRSDFVVVAEHAPCRAGRRACPHRQFVVAGNLRRMRDGTLSSRAWPSAATSPTFRTAARCIRPAALSILTAARVAAVTISAT